MSLSEIEYSSLRRTIAVRGTVRVLLLPATLAVWAAFGLLVLLYSDLPVASLMSLAFLAGGFEAIHALHVGVERIGRYLQVYYENPSGPRWETTVLALGPGLPGGGTDPLYSAVFILTAFVNLLPALGQRPTALELLVIGAMHALFVVRVIRTRGAAARQRAVELESFRAMRPGSPTA